MSGDHHGMRPGDMPLPMAGLDDFETGLLTVLRHFCTSFATPETQGWIGAFRSATAFWGARDGAAAGQAMLAATQAMRITRPSVFAFSSPQCARCSRIITANERQMMRLIHAMRRGRMGEARAEAMLLCEGRDTAPLLEAVAELAQAFPSESAGRARSLIN